MHLVAYIETGQFTATRQQGSSENPLALEIALRKGGADCSDALSFESLAVAREKQQISRQRAHTAMQQWQSSLAAASAASCPAKAEPSPICTYCKESHAVSYCAAFAALSVSERAAARW